MSSSTREKSPVIVWFREDLRIRDNPALEYAASLQRPVLAIYVHDEKSPGIRKIGSAQKWLLHHTLADLDSSLKGMGGKLVVRAGAAKAQIAELVDDIDAKLVIWNRRIGRPATQVDAAIAGELRKDGIDVKVFNGSLMHDPGSLLTGEGTPYRVFSAFWRAFADRPGEPREPVGPVDKLEFMKNEPTSLPLADLDLLPDGFDWTPKLQEHWDAGETAALVLLDEFLENGLHGYANGRDIPGKPHVSRLSPYLRFGSISPNRVWHSVRQSGAPRQDVAALHKELAWRDYSYHLLHHFPDLATSNYNSRFDSFPWQDDRTILEAWRTAATGYPLIDAGMRQLWQTGYMHNRVRMVVASFLIKDLMLDWRQGEQWFWDTLIDGDPASNPFNWQWVAGSGVDAAPYFRIFNPVLQSRKFDPHGKYLRRWLPEIAELDDKHIHAPSDAPKSALLNAGIRLAEDYPLPIVDHKVARARAASISRVAKTGVSLSGEGETRQARPSRHLRDERS